MDAFSFKLVTLGLSMLLFGCKYKPGKEKADKANFDTSIGNSPKMSDTVRCTQKYNSFLVSHAISYRPDTIEFDKTFSKDLDSFLLHVDTNCLRNQSRIRIFHCYAYCEKLFI
jgi:hypothetical protein